MQAATQPNQEQQGLIVQFQQLTNTANSSLATRFLEMSKWDLQIAIGHYFESGPQDASATTPVAAAIQSSSSSAPAKKPQPTKVGGGIATLSSLNQNTSSGDDDSDNDEDAHRNLYTGGEKSGLSVQDPSKRKKGESSAGGGGELVESILKKAAEAGQKAIRNAKSTGAINPGKGYRLGSLEDPPSQSTSPTQSAQKSPVPREEEIIQCQLTFWKDGFSVNEDGPLMAYDDPANKEVLEHINNGRAPLSLFGLKHGQQADVVVKHRTGEMYKPAPKKFVPFGGSGGQRLGSNVPGESPSSASTSSAPVQSAAPAATVSPIQINPSLPTTTIQIRLATGARLRLQLNHSHTIADVRRFIEAQAGAVGRQYTLQTASMPIVELKDGAVTVEKAGVCGAVVVQKYL